MPRPALYDDHLHSHLSSDGHSSVLELCAAAVQHGLAGLTLTEHFDTDPSDPGYGRYDFDSIRRAADEARADFGDRLSLLVGAEVCYQRAFAGRIAAFIRACPLDFVLGSVHYARHEYVEPAYFARRTADEAYEGYFEAAEEAAASGLFDSFAHLDVPKRYAPAACGPFDPQRYWERIERILRLLVVQGTALEINSSGWRQAPGAPYPDEAILRRYVELGGERITVGSDAHRAAHVGEGVERAYDLARRLGLSHVTRFVGRRPVPILL